MAKAIRTKLLSFSTEDKPGLLAEITGRLAAAKVNITAICAYSWDHTAYVDIGADNTAKTKQVLAKMGFKVEPEDVIQMELPNRAGELDKVARVLAEAGINISYIYGTASSGRTSSVIFSTSDNRAALRKLAK